MASAATHSTSRASSGANPPATQSTAETTLQARMRSNMMWKSWSLGVAYTLNMLRTSWSTTYEQANSGARSPNASGMATDISRLAAITSSSTSRTGTESGSNQLVIQVV